MKYLIILLISVSIPTFACENKEDKCIAVYMDCMKRKVAGASTPKSCKDEYNKCHKLDTKKQGNSK